MCKEDQDTVIVLSHPSPGETLLEDFMKPLELNQRQLALKLGVAPQMISEIVRGKRAITPDTALRLELAFGTSAEFWLGLQNEYDLSVVRDKKMSLFRQEVTSLQR